MNEVSPEHPHATPCNAYCNGKVHGFIMYMNTDNREKAWVEAFRAVVIDAGWKDIHSVSEAETPIPEELKRGVIPEGYDSARWMPPGMKATEETRPWLVIAEIR